MPAEERWVICQHLLQMMNKEKEFIYSICLLLFDCNYDHMKCLSRFSANSWTDWNYHWDSNAGDMFIRDYFHVSEVSIYQVKDVLG